MSYKMTPGPAIVVSGWSPGTDVGGMKHEAPESVDAAVCKRARYVGAQGSITGYEGSFLYFQDPKTRRVYAQRLPIESMLESFEEWGAKHVEWGQECGGFYGKCCKANKKRRAELADLKKRIKSGKPFVERR